MSKCQNGYWDDPEVPQINWYLDHVIDLGYPDGLCEMCQVQRIRYVHVMNHDKHSQLRCGCICAGRMSGDPDKHLEVEARMRKKAARKVAWAQLSSWKLSRKGNLYIKKDGVLIVRYQGHEGLWSFSVNGERSDQWFDTVKEVADATFEAYWDTIHPHQYAKRVALEKRNKQSEFTYDPSKFAVPTPELQTGAC